MHVSDPDPSFALPWQGTGLSDIGLVRTSNQDALALDNPLGLWVIADGMGGHAAGSLASQLAVQSVIAHMHEVRGLLSTTWNQSSTASNLLVEAVATGHSAIRQEVSAHPEFEGMGTTVVIALYCPGPSSKLAIAHVGDSRAYLIRNRTIRLMTSDHSLVQRLITEGQIAPEEAVNHPQQNILLRALGADEQSKPDIHLHDLEAEDIVLLCTDGLTKAATEKEILSTVLADRMLPSSACQKLIEIANERGGKDNSTVVLISQFPHAR
jgi:protein phosphatase